MKKVITIIITLIMVLCAVSATAERTNRPALAECYPTTALITALDYDTDIVTCVTFNGRVYHFLGIYDWAEWDLVSLYVWDAGTCIDRTDDVVLDVENGGWLEEDAVNMWLNH